MRPKVKYQVIYRHQDAYPVSVMCTFFGVSRSGYYDYVKRINRPEKDAPLAALLRKQQEHCFQTYGYRRMHLWLERQGIHHNPKTVLRVMEKYGLLSEIRRERKWKNLGQQVHKYQNLLLSEIYCYLDSDNFPYIYSPFCFCSILSQSRKFFNLIA